MCVFVGGGGGAVGVCVRAFRVRTWTKHPRKQGGVNMITVDYAKEKHEQGSVNMTAVYYVKHQQKA